MIERRTVEVYEERAQEWTARRRPADLDRAVELGSTARPTGPVADLGCGPGWYTDALGGAVLALDAAAAMLRQARERAGGAWLVQGDLAALPVRSGAMAAAWANASYVHLARTKMPSALGDLHRSLAVGAPVQLLVFAGDQELGPVPDDDFPGRQFSLWPEDLLTAVIEGAGFDSVAIQALPGRRGGGHLVIRAVRARTLADSVAPGMRLLVCGLNPSLYSADRGIGYARPGNRFWPAAIAAGIVSRDRDPGHALLHHRVGITDLVKRATVAASELTSDEHRHGLARVERLCSWLQPAAVCFVGLAGWRAAVDRGALPGPQDRTVGGRPAYLMPSTSGLNARSSATELADHLRSAAALADAA